MIEPLGPLSGRVESLLTGAFPKMILRVNLAWMGLRTVGKPVSSSGDFRAARRRLVLPTGAKSIASILILSAFTWVSNAVKIYIF